MDSIAILVGLGLAAGVGSLAASLRRQRQMRQTLEAELATARGAAEAGARARADFLAMMSHEIRTPLNGILGMAGLLHDLPADSKLGPTERHYVSVILQSGEHLLQLVNDILDFSRLDAGRLDLEVTAFDVRAVIGSAVELMRTEARRKNLALTVEIAREVPVRAGGDPGRLRQVLLNLVGNAVKFTEHGSVHLGVRRIADADGGMRLEFSITDTGIGISPNVLERLFREFVQADSSISRRFGGSGLGLAISRQLVAKMGGTIEVESQLGQGSVFRFDIKLRARRATDRGLDDQPAPLPLPPPPERAPVSPRHVLVAEDNPTNRLVVTRLLERQGHKVSTVGNGLEAVEAVRTGSFDLVLMDMMMPELDGLAATAQIRALPAPVGQTPIIGLTANTLSSDAEACAVAGMDGFATKPISAERLADAIAQALAPYHSQDIQALSMPITAENRGFDPAVLDALVRTQGQEIASAAVSAFVARRAETLAKLSDLAASGDGAGLARLAHHVANEAAAFGLMRAARAGLDLTPDATADTVSSFLLQLSQGLDDLRAWRRSSVL